MIQAAAGGQIRATHEGPDVRLHCSLYRIRFLARARAISCCTEIIANRNNTLYSRQAVPDPRLSRHCPTGSARTEAARCFRTFAENWPPLATKNSATVSVTKKCRGAAQLFPFKFKSTRICEKIDTNFVILRNLVDGRPVSFYTCVCVRTRVYECVAYLIDNIRILRKSKKKSSARLDK